MILQTVEGLVFGGYVHLDITLKEVEVFQTDWDVAKAFEPPFNFPVP